MNTFIYINGRPDHQKGHHDDLIMGIAMATYVGENSFNQLQKVTEQTKAMLNSWQVNNNEESSKSITFNPVVPSGPMMGNQRFNNEPSKKDYENYGWLFGGRR
jgi:hypothetical protein